MIHISGTRFGSIDVDDTTVFEFPAGLVGFPHETRFALLHGGREAVAHLQSLRSPQVALVVVDRIAFGPDYPNPNAYELAASVGLGKEDPVVFVPIAVRAGAPQLYANLLAPIVIDATARRGAQVVLDPRVYSAWTKVTRDRDGRVRAAVESETSEAVTP